MNVTVNAFDQVTVNASKLHQNYVKCVLSTFKLGLFASRHGSLFKQQHADTELIMSVGADTIVLDS